VRSRGCHLSSAGHLEERHEGARARCRCARARSARTPQQHTSGRVRAVCAQSDYSAHCATSFLPAYDAAYRSLQGSLGRFLDASKHAINSPKQRFLYMLGSFWFVCGLILFVAATIAPPHSLTHSGTSIFRARLLRLAAIPFLFQGALQLGSASRGFCLRVGSRGRTQLRSWELAHATAETQAWWINVVSDPPRGVLDTDVDDVGDGSPRTARDLEAAISPDTAASAVRHAARERARLLAELEQISPFAQPGTVEMSSLERPHGSHSPLASPTSPRSPRSPLSPPPTSGALLPSPSSASVRGRPGQPIAIEVGPARRNTLDIASIKHFSYGSAIDSIDGEVYRPEPMPTKTGLVHDYPPTPDAYTAPPTRRPRTRSSNGYRTPPVFGPERVVLDPRVQAMHLRIWREIFGTAIIIGLVSCPVSSQSTHAHRTPIGFHRPRLLDSCYARCLTWRTASSFIFVLPHLPSCRSLSLSLTVRLASLAHSTCAYDTIIYYRCA
jgi:hypothetical protein